MSEIKRKTIHDGTYLVLLDCLRMARQKAGVSQTDLASRLGMDQSYISRYERAERRLDIVEVRSICHALGQDFAIFIGDFEEQLKNASS